MDIYNMNKDMKAKLVRESLFTKFSDGPVDIIKEWKLGLRYGFTAEMLGIEHNNGINSLYVTPKSLDRIFPEITQQRIINFDIISTGYKIKNKDPLRYAYRCDIILKLISKNNEALYKVIGRSGTHGFAGGESTKRETLGKTYVKQILEQVYNEIKRRHQELIANRK